MRTSRAFPITVWNRVAHEALQKLRLTLHPDKVFIKTLASGVDFLGWVHFPDHRVIRTTTKRRMYRRLEQTEWNEQGVQSYLGLLSHGNAAKLQGRVRRQQAARE